MTTLKTDERLLQALRESSTRALTAQELDRQRVSFIMGSLSTDSAVTRAQVKEILDRHEGVKAAR
jgi:glutamine synthetase adenylyltransferase